MHPYLCTTCGTQFAPSAEPPAACPICEDARQYVPPTGQRWTTPADLRRTHRNGYRRLRAGRELGAAGGAEVGVHGFLPVRIYNRVRK